MAFGDYLHCEDCVAGVSAHGWSDPSDNTKGLDAWPGYKIMYVGHLEVPEGMVVFCLKHAPKKTEPNI